ARTVLASGRTSRRQRRLDRALADARSAPLLYWPCARHGGQTDRRCECRCVARLNEGPLREPGPRAGRVESSRMLHDGREGGFLVPLDQAIRLPRARRRPDGAAAARATPTPVPARTSARTHL